MAYSDEHTGVGSLGSDALWETEPLAGYVRGWAGMARIDRSGF